MKIKNDFITNSSSSSFIVAVRENLTRADIRKELLEKGSLKEYLDEYKNYWGPYDEEDYGYEDDTTEIARLETEEEQLALLAEKIADSIYAEIRNALKLGDFNAFAYEGSSEDIELFSNWLYAYANINTDNIKIRAFD